MSRKIVAIGGGENGCIRPDGSKLPYETAEIDSEIINLSGKAKSNFLLLAHSQIPWGEVSETRYFETMKRIYGDIYGCDCKTITVKDLKDNFNEAIKLVEWADIIYEGGGNTYDMIQLWKETGFDKVLRKAWESEKVMCGISAGAICWFSLGNTDDPRFKDDECNGIKGLGFVDAYLSPHCNEEGKRESEIRSLKNIDKVGISLSNCSAIEIIDDKYRILTSTPEDKNFVPYALKTYWKNEKCMEQPITVSNDFESINELLEMK